MITQKQSLQYIKQLQEHYPQAFKKNVLWYGFIPVKGALDEWKEIIPWLIAFTAFMPITYFLNIQIHQITPTFTTFQYLASAVILITLFLMMIIPMIIYQIHHSSAYLYQSIKNTPFKIAILIILQAINFKFFESSLLLGVLFFLTMRYGFISFCKENLFKDHTTSIDYKNLLLIRKACFWSHIKIIKCTLQLKLTPKTSPHYQIRTSQKLKVIQLNKELVQFENELYKSLKYTDLETYIDELMK